MSDKQMILDTLQRLPEDVTFEQVREEIEILAALQRARQASADGRVFTLEEARRKAAQWTLK